MGPFGLVLEPVAFFSSVFCFFGLDSNSSMSLSLERSIFVFCLRFPVFAVRSTTSVPPVPVMSMASVAVVFDVAGVFDVAVFDVAGALKVSSTVIPSVSATGVTCTGAVAGGP